MLDECRKVVLDLINHDRGIANQQYGLELRGYTLNLTQSNGVGSCVGSQGHSQAMADSGDIWHQNPDYPAASFGNDLCVSYMTAGENVGQWDDKDWIAAFQGMDDMMMSEQHDPAYCKAATNHACNILSPNFTSVGIGIVHQGKKIWLTEDFIG